MAAIDQSIAEERIDDLPLAELLGALGAPERVNYAAGVLLDSEDFLAEQRYHRGRLARALSVLFGFGTVAGLKVECPVTDNAELRVTVHPGVALDRVGRLIEVRRSQCLRIGRWLSDQATAAEETQTRLRASVIDAGDGGKAVVFDVFVRHAACPHGKTPAFAAGPFSATDFVVPHRIADAFDMTLELAALAGDPKQPVMPGVSLGETATALGAAPGPAPQRTEALENWMEAHVFSAWPAYDGGALPPLAEHASEKDWDKLLLARIPVPVKPGPATGGAEPLPVPDLARLDVLKVNNALRPVAFNPLRWRGRLKSSL